MELYILNDKFQEIACIDEFESVLWTKFFRDVGYCEIHTLFDTELWDLLKIGYYITRKDDNMACIITKKSIETDVENGDYLTVYAVDVKSILNRRIVWNDINVKDVSISTFIHTVLNENVKSPTMSDRAIPNFTIDLSGSSDFNKYSNITYSTNKDNVLKLITDLCTDYNIGFQVTLKDGKFIFKLLDRIIKYDTSKNNYVEFSPEFSNILSSNYEETDESYKNVCLIGGEKKDNNQEFATYPQTISPRGLERREIYNDSGLSKTYKDESGVEQTYTDEEYKKLLLDNGRVVLSNNSFNESFTGEVDIIDTYTYKKDYNIGDMVVVRNNYGISTIATISSVMESEDIENKYQVEPHFEY